MNFLRFIPPKLTTAQRDLITSAEDGEVIYNLDTKQLNVYNGNLTIWEPVGAGDGTAIGSFIRINNSASQQLNTTGQTQINLNTLDEKDDSSSLNFGTNEVVIDKPGNYTLVPFLGIDSNGTARADPFLKLTLNGAVIQDSLGRDILFTGVYARNQGAIENGGGSLSLTKKLNAGDRIGMIAERANIDLNQVFTIPNATYLEVRALQTAEVTEESKALIPYHFTQFGQASSTTGLFGKARSNGFGFEFGNPTASPFDIYVNGNIDPYRIGENKRIKKVLFYTSVCAVGTGTVDPNVSVNIQLFTIQNSSQTLLTTIEISLDATNIGVFNNLGSTTNPKTVNLDVDIAIPNNSLIGIQFQNVNANDKINALGFTNITLEIE